MCTNLKHRRPCVPATICPQQSSMHPESKHFADQRAMYQNQEVKKMTLDKQVILKNAEAIYHPQ